jgi:GT2 family glycosyltransferase
MDGAMKLKPKKWSEFQHYKNRSPSWIKLHAKLLDDVAFQRLPRASQALAPMLWLIAREQASCRARGLVDDLPRVHAP